MKKLFCLFLILFLASCDDEPNTFFTLGDFRVLTLIADTPEIDGTSATPVPVQITPYISDIDAAGRTVSLTILACVDPGLDLGNEPTCNPNSADTQSIAYASVSTSTLGPKYTGALPSFTVNVPPGLLTGANAENKFNGLGYLVTVKFKAGSDETSVYKRIIVSERTTRNHNPKINHVLLNGYVAGDLKDQDELTISVTPGFNAETYDFKDSDGSIDEKKEEYIVSWFSYRGTTDLSRAFLDEKTTFEIEKGEINPFVIAILRDDRGGIDVQLHD